MYHFWSIMLSQALSNNNKSDDKLVSVFNKYVHGEIISIEEIPNDLPAKFIHSKSKILSLAKILLMLLPPHHLLPTMMVLFSNIMKYQMSNLV